ncbi:Snf7-domain-containing protein [Xylariomycetidae sp. FL0641]|nr:Snf7-domain-containing protein [Xylariomycetidae sp. FL0641]
MNVLEWAFGKRMTPAERLRKNQRMVNKAIREMDQEINKLQRQEKTLYTQIKKSAEKGEMGAARIQAKDYVRTQKYITKFYQAKSGLETLNLNIQRNRTNDTMMKATADAAKVMGQMNRSSNPASLQRIAMEFERENDMMEQRQEMMDDAMDNVMDVDEEESDEQIDKVMADIGVNLSQSLGDTPNGLTADEVPEHRVAQAIGGPSGGGDAGDDDLQARLDSLRK